MTALLILSIVLLVLAFLLLMPVTIKAGYHTELWANVRYLFFKYKIAPREEKPEKKKKIEKKEQKKEEPEEENSIWDMIKETGLSGFLHIIKELVKVVGGALNGILRRATITKLFVQVAVCGEDAADCAVNYGYVCTAVYPAVGVVTSAVKKYKKLNIDIRPDYDGGESRVNCEVSARAPMVFVLFHAATGGYRALKQFIKAKQQGIL